MTHPPQPSPPARRFEVVRSLGAGGQGRVLAVRDAALGGRLVALKEAAAHRRAELAREFQILARLRHPNLVWVGDFFAHSPVAPPGPEAPVAYTQELVDGVDLRRALLRAGGQERARAFEELFRALAYLHALDIFHFDLKPANVLVRSDDGRVQVLDFGIASAPGVSAAPRQGSMSYVAPERLAGAAGDHRADLFAVGVMMAESWAGEAPPLEPARGPAPSAQARRAWLHQHGVPESWQDTILALTQRRPEDRPGDVGEAASRWARDLGRSLTLHPPAAVAAILRAGPPAGREEAVRETTQALLDGRALALVGVPGVGRRAVARAAARAAQGQGAVVEWWPAQGVRDRTPSSLAAVLERLAGLPQGASALAAARRVGAPLPTGQEDPDAYAARTAREARAAAEAYWRAAAGRPSAGAASLVAGPLETLSRPARAVLEALCEASPGDRLGLVVLAEPSAPTGCAEHLELGPLDREAVEALVAGRLGPTAAHRRVAAAIAAASGGLPRHVETLLELMVQRGDLRFDGRRWRATLRPLPADFAAAVRARVEALPPPARRLLGALAWLRFPSLPSELAAALNGPPAEALGLLITAGLVWEGGDGRLILASAVVARAAEGWGPTGAYDREAHARLLALPSLLPLARALHTGGQAGAALAVAAGEEAWASGDVEGAREAADLALELTPGDIAGLALRARVADLLGPRSAQIEALKRLSAALPPASLGRLRADNRLLWALTRTGDIDRVEPLGRDVLARAEAQGARSEIAHALVHLGFVATQRGQLDEAARCLRRAAAEADALGDRDLAARAWNNLGNVHAYRDEQVEALGFYERALEAKRAQGDAVGQRIALGNVALMELGLGRPAAALTHFAESHRAARSLGHRRGEAWSLLALAVVGLEANAWSYAQRRARAARALALDLGDGVIACDALGTLAEIALGTGRRGQALEMAEAALGEAETLRSAFNDAGARAVRALARAETAPADSQGEAGRVWDDPSADARIRALAGRARVRAAARLGALGQATAAARACLGLPARALGLQGLVEAVEALALGAPGAEVAAARGAAVAALDEGRGAWPAAPLSDGVDAQSAIDGPCRGTFTSAAAAAKIERWRGDGTPRGGDAAATRTHGPGARPMIAAGTAGTADAAGTSEEERDMTSDGTAGGALGASAAMDLGPLWEALGGDESGRAEALQRAVAAVVVAAGAERGFVVGREGQVLASSDLDGDAIAGAERKLPAGAVEEARRSRGPWRATGAGSLWAWELPTCPATATDESSAATSTDAGTDGGPPPADMGARGDATLVARAEKARVVVLQNRFAPDAFEPLAQHPEAAPAVALLAAVAGVDALARARDEAVTRRAELEQRAALEATRSTEEILRLRRELETTRELAPPAHGYDEIVFTSRPMRAMLRRLDRIVDSDLPVYIQGESGTGKELVARAVHAHGPRAKGPFVAQNCSAIPASLFESELFGHERGSFTGADRASEGLFRRASGGTLFLDEVGDLPLDLQAKLLRVLETSEVRPVGGRRTHKVDVRIVCATHRDLHALVGEGQFREDLYYRLNVVRVDVPPLRERPDDIPVLVEHFLGQREPRPAITPGVMRALVRYGWPGNVRQLENEVTRAALLCDEAITVDDLSEEVREGDGRRHKEGPKVAGLGLDRGPLKERVERLERWALRRALERHGGNKSQIARELGLSRAGLNMKLKRLGLWEDKDA